MLPNQAVRDEEIIRIQVHIIHHGRKEGLHPNDLTGFHIEGITGENFLEEEGDDITSIKRGLDTGGAVERRPG